MIREKTTNKLTQKSCKQITALISGYLNNELSPRVRRDFEAHLELCPDCVNFLNTYKKTMQVSRTVNPGIMPAKVRDNILIFLRKQIRRAGVLVLYSIAHFFA